MSSLRNTDFGYSIQFYYFNHWTEWEFIFSRRDDLHEKFIWRRISTSRLLRLLSNHVGASHWHCFTCRCWSVLDYEERTQFVKRLIEEVKCNTREYVAICVYIKVLQPEKIGGKRSGRGRRVTLEAQHSFSKIDARSAMLCELMDCQRYFSRTSAYGNLNRNKLWPLNLFSLVGTPITISEQ